MPFDERERGFILPLAILLVVILTISGTAFIHHDYLERRMAMNNADNHSAFYLANGGVERARADLKIDIVNSVPSWTGFLQDAALADTTPNEPNECIASECLCPTPAKGCALTPFGSPVASPDVPFGGTFDDGEYLVRAFNDSAESDTNDVNGMITIRAIGRVRGEAKLLEATVKGVSGLGLVNCVPDAPNEHCPEESGSSITLDNVDGREPRFWDEVLPFEFPLSDSQNYYRQPSNFGWLEDRTGSTTLADGGYYSITGDIDVNSNLTDVVIFATGDITVSGGPVLTRVTLVAQNSITTHGNVTLTSAAPLPAIIAGNTVDFGSGSVIVTGNIIAVQTIALNPITVNGLLISDDVQLQGNTTITDGNTLDPYAFMPGFHYDPEDKAAAIVSGSWREIR